MPHSSGPTSSRSPMTTPWAVGGGDSTNASEVRMRTFAEIIAAEKSQRNILNIHVQRNVQAEDKSLPKPKNLTFDDLGEFIFDILKINPEDCIGFNYNTGRYNSREIKFKPGVELAPFIKSNIVFKDHTISTSKQMQNFTKVSFRNVPFNIPDKEIVQLCNSYGKVCNNKVKH